MFADIQLVDFYERKFKQTKLVTSNDLTDISKNNINDCIFAMISSIDNMRKCLRYCSEETAMMLSIGDGKISLCGIGMISSMSYQDSKEYNLYIHSCDLFQADILVKRCLETIKHLPYSKRDNYVLINLGSSIIRLYLDVYEDRGQILRNNGSVLEKYGWDPIMGYFSTNSSLSTLLMGITLERADDKQHIFYGDVLEQSTKYYTFHNIDRDVTPDLQIIEEIYNFSGDKIMSPRLVENKQVPYIKYVTIKTQLFVEQYPKINIRQYVNHTYMYTLVGISDDRYVAFCNIIKRFNITNDILKLLSLYWFKAEVNIAKERLLK